MDVTSIGAIRFLALVRALRFPDSEKKKKVLNLSLVGPTARAFIMELSLNSSLLVAVSGCGE